jgi:hypothetical protein
MSAPPTLLSTFEVLFTPQLPGPAPAGVAVENVIKGYFLTLSNPNATDYRFTLGFHCNVNPMPTPPAVRTLASAVGFIDDGTTAGQLTISSVSATAFTASVPVSANGTVLVGVLPLFFNMMGGLVTANIEVRGWVDITLPTTAKIVRVGNRFVIESTAQATGPVQIIATPEQRLTFLPQSGAVATAVEAQAAFALPLASGAAAFSVPPQQPFVFQAHAQDAKDAIDFSSLERWLATSPVPPEELGALIAERATQPAGAANSN